MPKLVGKRGVWEFSHVHAWAERTPDLAMARTPLFGPKSNLAFLGPCTAVSMAATLRRWGLQTATHPDGHFHDSKTIRQAALAAVEKWPERERDGFWKLGEGVIDPFAKSHMELVPTEEEAGLRRKRRDERARRILAEADLVFIALDTVQVWKNTVTGNYYPLLPPSAVFPQLQVVPKTLTIAEVKRDLCDTLAAVRAIPGFRPNVPVVVCTTAVPLHATVFPGDVRVASLASLVTLRSAIAELISEIPGIHYFPYADVVLFSNSQAAFTEADGRHYSLRAAEYLSWLFVQLFATGEVQVPRPDLSWLTPTASRKDPPAASRKSRWGRLAGYFRRSA